LNNNSGNNTRLIVSITILIITSMLMLDRLVPQGIFLDGVTYAAISRNLAIGKGSFWSLYYRGDWIFSEHPPLFFGIQAMFFKLFGDHYLTEKIYSFFIWVVTVILLKSLWNSTKTDTDKKYSYALPVVLWCLVPTVTWAYTNNILDSTMAVFDLAAVLILYKTWSAKDERTAILPMTIAGILIFAATLTKGPVGAFPLAVPGIYWLVFHLGDGKKFISAAVQTIFMLLVVVAWYFILYQFPEPRANFSRYFNEQLIAALSGRREITTGSMGRWLLLYELMMQMLVPVAITVILIVTARLLKLSPLKQSGAGKNALFFLLLGVCASLPIMMSVKQRTFYLIPSLPYYVMAIALLAYPYYLAITERYKGGANSLRYFKISAAVVSLALCVYLGTKVGQIGRDGELIKNMNYLASKFPKGQVFGICAEADKDYNFLAYLQRYNQMEVNPVFYATEYVLIDKRVCNSGIIPYISRIGFRQEPLEMDNYELYRRRFPLKFDFTLLNPVYQTKGK